MMHRFLGSAIVLTVAALVGCAPSGERKPSAAPRQESVTADIGPAGGSFELRSGASLVRVVVPPAAVDEQLRFEASGIDAPAGAIASPVELGPHGARFRAPVELEFQPDLDALPASVNPLNLSVATLVDGRWELLPTRFTQGGVIESSTTHFSTFALVETCHTTGTGTDFPLVGCGNINPTVTTDVPITLDVTGAPLSVELRFAPTAAAGNVTVQISGLRPSWTYWIVAGGATNQSGIVTDAAGTLSYVQQVDGNRRMAILSAVHGSIALTPATCTPPLGEFDPATNTCNLTADIVDPPVYLRTNNITLDCQDPHTGARHRIGDPAARFSDGVASRSTSRFGLPTALPDLVRPVAFTRARPERTRSRTTPRAA